MNKNTIAAAILARIKADTGTGGLYSKPVEGSSPPATTWNTITRASYLAGDPATLSVPYIVYDIELDNSEDTDDGPGGKFTVTFNIYDTVARATATELLGLVTDRLIGDAALSTGTNAVPTYGFHNHKLDLGTNTLGMVAGRMRFIDSPAVVTTQEPSYYVDSLRFEGAWAIRAENV